MKPRDKLAVTRETIRPLSSTELARAGGGLSYRCIRVAEPPQTWFQRPTVIRPGG